MVFHIFEYDDILIILLAAHKDKMKSMLHYKMTSMSALYEIKSIIIFVVLFTLLLYMYLNIYQTFYYQYQARLL